MTTAVVVDLPAWVDTIITWLTVAGLVFLGGFLIVVAAYAMFLGLEYLAEKHEESRGDE